MLCQQSTIRRARLRTPLCSDHQSQKDAMQQRALGDVSKATSEKKAWLYSGELPAAVLVSSAARASRSFELRSDGEERACIELNYVGQPILLQDTAVGNTVALLRGVFFTRIPPHLHATVSNNITLKCTFLSSPVGLHYPHSPAYEPYRPRDTI